MKITKSDEIINELENLFKSDELYTFTTNKEEIKEHGGGEAKTGFIYSNGEEKKRIENLSGVYVIYDNNGKVYYIGQSFEVLNRLKRHYNKENGIFKDINQSTLKNYKVKVVYIHNEVYNYSDMHLRFAVEGLAYILVGEMRSDDNKVLYNEELYKFLLNYCKNCGQYCTTKSNGKSKCCNSSTEKNV